MLCRAWESVGPGKGCGVRVVKAQECSQGAEMVLQRRTTKNEEAVSQPWWILAGEEKERLGKR